ncbi:hypothetical protein LCM20_16480 [Halobacillus litoralis]|uniref:hypothetical protein n=1 Tax=Halobacillus litoralis TaxID=45668 RepID=UPI001CD1E6E4|nr:hypothetical protein [Halobacillus litoralis]MCA0972206.1 hypothetical protein [Halobacillus litoralis]
MMKKWSFVVFAILLLILFTYLFIDSRALDIDESDLPVDRELAIHISQRNLAGGWTPRTRLDGSQYEMKKIEETRLTFEVYIVDESDTSWCKGYKFIIEKSTGEIINKNRMNYCN